MAELCWAIQEVYLLQRAMTSLLSGEVREVKRFRNYSLNIVPLEGETVGIE